jgi:hypothetical protein
MSCVIKILQKQKDVLVKKDRKKPFHKAIHLHATMPSLTTHTLYKDCILTSFHTKGNVGACSFTMVVVNT